METLLSSATSLAHAGTREGTTLALCMVLPLLVILCKSWILQKKQKQDGTIPLAPNHSLLFGHALQYKKNPPGFLQASQDAAGPLFRINLLGRRMIVIGADQKLHLQMARQVESTLSSCQAIAQVGFDYSLGRHNVFMGTEFHKRLLKNYISQDVNAFCQRATQEMKKALDKELLLIDMFAPKQGDDDEYGASSQNMHYTTVPDLFQLARITMLRTILAVFCGTCFLQDKNVFLLKEFMELQDKIESATAAAAVLPRSVANVLFLKPTQKFRQKVQDKIIQIIQKARLVLPKMPKDVKRDVPYYGPWLVAMDEQKMDVSLMAELIVGLVFAAHKNPAIGAAQAFCHLWEQENTDSNMQFFQKVQTECKFLLQEKKNVTLDQLQNGAPTLRACVEETTRITAHSLGGLRHVCKETTLEDENGRQYTLYPGETIASSHFLYNVDAKFFPKRLHHYRPDILLQQQSSDDADNKATKTRPLTFSEGTHKCPGEGVAMMLMPYFVALLVERNACVVGPLPPISFARATLAQRQGPVPVRLAKPRRIQSKQPKARGIIVSDQ